MISEQTEQAAISPGSSMDRKIERRRLVPWRSKALLAAAAILLSSILLWQIIPAADSTDMSKSEIEIAAVTRSEFEDYVPVRATVVPAVTTLVGVLSGGQVAELLVQDGALVARGQPLAALANPALQLEVLTREAQIASQLGAVAGEDLGIARNRMDRAGELAQAEYDLLKARRDLSVRQQLHERGLVSDAGVVSYVEAVDYQVARLSQLRSGSAEERRIIAVQGARLGDTRAKLQRNMTAVRGSLSSLIIRAPMSGRLTNFTLQPGQNLEPGAPAGQVDSEGAWKLTADVDEYYLGRVAIGQSAIVGNARLTVSKILPAVSNGRFHIELSFDGPPPPGLNRGQTLNSRIVLSQAGRAVLAPVGNWLQSEGGTSVFVVDEDGDHARRRAIRTGRRNPQRVEILAGLEPGERIILSDTSSVTGDLLNLR